MKKRLLSAALALAMVLTMLPLSALPAFAAGTYSAPTATGDGTESVSWVEYDNGTNKYFDENGSKATADDFPGWFATVNVPAGSDPKAEPKYTAYCKVESGVSLGGKYYSLTNAGDSATGPSSSSDPNTTIYNWSFPSGGGSAAKTGLKSGTIIVFGGSGDTLTIDVIDATSLTNLEVYGGTVTVKQTNSTGKTTKLTTLTVNNSNYAKYGKAGTITLDNTIDSLTNLTLKHVSFGTGNIKLDAKQATTNKALTHSVTLEDVSACGTVTLDGVGGETAPAKPTYARQTLSIKNSKTGNITVKGQGDSVTLDEVSGTTDPTVTIEGTGGTLTVKGGSTLGAVTVVGDTASDKDQTTRPCNVEVQTGSTVASIKSGIPTSGTEWAKGKNTITVAGKVTGTTEPNVQALNADVKVTAGQTGAITITSGTVTVSGNRAEVGDVTLTKDATFDLTGTNCTVGKLMLDSNAVPGTVTFKVPNDPSNTLGASTAPVATDYTKRTIKGGTWLGEVPAQNLDESLVYQLKKGTANSTYTYYTADQLGEALIAQGGAASDPKLTKIGDISTASDTVTFMNGATTWGILTISAGQVIPKLPTQMNNINTPYWNDGTASNLAGKYPVPTGGATLNAGGGATTTDVTKLTGVTVKAGGGTAADADIKASLVGNTITLSGALDKTSIQQFTLTLETDAVTADTTGGGSPTEVPVTIGVTLTFDPSDKSLTVNQGAGGTMELGNGVIIENGFEAIKLANGSRYTFDGKGLVLRDKTIKVQGVDTVGTGADNYPDNDYVFIDVIVSDSKYTGSETLKQQIRDLIVGSNAEFDWSKSPAAKRAVNAALASISDKDGRTVEGYINAAATRARRDCHLGSKDDTAYNVSGAEVWLVPYLEVNVSNWQPNSDNPALTATLTMKWRVEVHPATGDTRIAKTANDVLEGGIFIAKTGTALTLDEDLTDSAGANGIDITFDSGLGVATGTFAHQADIYDYAITAKKFTVTHAVNGNLGRFVLDTQEPLIKVGTDAYNSTSNPVHAVGVATGYFSTLQAAVDAATDSQLVEINKDYTGSTNINMTGKARTIYVQSNGKNVVVANASGDLVEHNNKGSYYTIKLNRDNTVIANASISVGSAGNGTASVNTTVAKPGNTVSGTYTANSGYKAGTFTATAQPGNKSVTVSVSANGTFSFTVPSDATSVTVTPSFVLDTGLPFTDVYATDWYFDGVKYCYNTTNNGYRLMTGFSDTQFGANRPYTRAEVVTILWNMKGRPTPGAATQNYTDVAGHWGYNAIVWATNNGYAEGYPDGTFRPNQSVTREEMVVFLWRAAGKPTTYNSISLNGYTDGYNVHDWGLSAVKWAVALNILSGQNSVSLNGTLAARSTAYRREVAVTVMNFDKMNLF